MQQRAQAVGSPGLTTPPSSGARAWQNSGTLLSIQNTGWEKHPGATGLNLTGYKKPLQWQFSHSPNTQVQEKAVTSKRLPRLHITTRGESLVPTSAPVNSAVRRSPPKGRCAHQGAQPRLSHAECRCRHPSLHCPTPGYQPWLESSPDSQGETKLPWCPGGQEPRDPKACFRIPVSKS